MSHKISEILGSLPLTFIPIFVAIDIFGILPIFTAMTAGISDVEKRTIVRQSTITALIVSILFVAIGEAVFNILGITVDDFKIGGGLLLLVLAIIELIKPSRQVRGHDEPIGIVPIGVPLIVGPAVLTTLIVLIGHYGVILTLISLFINLLIVWIVLNSATRMTRFIGMDGILAISKVMALLLAAIAVMMIRRGIEGLYKAYQM
ncbi:MAG: MarC family protein [Thermodesulfovibrionia bacterium]